MNATEPEVREVLRRYVPGHRTDDLTPLETAIHELRDVGFGYGHIVEILNEPLREYVGEVPDKRHNIYSAARRAEFKLLRGGKPHSGFPEAVKALQAWFESRQEVLV